MRSLLSALFLLVAPLSPALAQGPCTEINTQPAQRVHYGSRGFVPVVVVIEMPVAAGQDVEAEAAKGFVRFWIAGDHRDVKIDADHVIDTVHACTFMFKQDSIVELTKKTYLRLRMMVADGWNTKSSYFLRAGIYLPSSLVAKHPAVGTTLDTGTSFSGNWEQVRVDMPPAFAKKFAKKKGKDKSVTVTQLVLRPTGE